MNLKTAILFFAIGAPLHLNAQEICSADTRPHHGKTVRVILANCPPATTLRGVRKNGDETTPFPLTPEPGSTTVWLGEGYPEAMKTVALCSNICGYASECAAAVPRWDDVKNKCYAEYTFTCGPESWKLKISSTSSPVVIFERSSKQRGAFKATPNSAICDLAFDEHIVITKVDNASPPNYDFTYELLKTEPNGRVFKYKAEAPRQVGQNNQLKPNEEFLLERIVTFAVDISK